MWNRSGFERRLAGFTITLFDAERKPVFRATDIAAPQAMEIDVKNGGRLRYLTYNGKKGKPLGRAPLLAGDDGPKSDASTSEPALADVPADYRDPLPFAFQKGDVVAILGNGLADRMQHDGWLETLLQSQLGDQQRVRFRTMSASGDRPNDYPRSTGHMSMAAYLKHVQPTVVFAFFGYNESFDTSTR